MLILYKENKQIHGSSAAGMSNLWLAGHTQPYLMSYVDYLSSNIMHNMQPQPTVIKIYVSNVC